LIFYVLGGSWTGPWMCNSAGWAAQPGDMEALVTWQHSGFPKLACPAAAPGNVQKNPSCFWAGGAGGARGNRDGKPTWGPGGWQVLATGKQSRRAVDTHTKGPAPTPTSTRQNPEGPKKNRGRPRSGGTCEPRCRTRGLAPRKNNRQALGGRVRMGPGDLAKNRGGGTRGFDIPSPPVTITGAAGGGGSFSAR